MIERYRKMLLIRRFEEKAGQLFGMGMIDGYCHLCIGQEASVVGIQSALGDHDSVIAGYRAHGHMLASGMEPGRIMAEMTGRKAGYSGGKGGSIHIFDPENRFYGGHGMVGSQIAIATGLAFAHRYRDDDGICVCYLGDGAADQGQFFESMVLASRFELPVLFVIENNASDEALSLADRGRAFGIPGNEVDGMDVEAVAAVTRELLQSVRAGQPIILETRTQRFRGHSMADPAKYRSRDERDQATRHDPIEAAKQHLLDIGVISADELRAIDKETRQICNDAANMALDSPEPPASDLLLEVTA